MTESVCKRSRVTTRSVLHDEVMEQLRNATCAIKRQLTTMSFSAHGRVRWDDKWFVSAQGYRRVDEAWFVRVPRVSQDSASEAYAMCTEYERMYMFLNYVQESPVAARCTYDSSGWPIFQ